MAAPAVLQHRLHRRGRCRGGRREPLRPRQHTPEHAPVPDEVEGRDAQQRVPAARALGVVRVQVGPDRTPRLHGPLPGEAVVRRAERERLDGSHAVRRVERGAERHGVVDVLAPPVGLAGHATDGHLAVLGPHRLEQPRRGPVRRRVADEARRPGRAPPHDAPHERAVHVVLRDHDRPVGADPLDDRDVALLPGVALVGVPPGDVAATRGVAPHRHAGRAGRPTPRAGRVGARRACHQTVLRQPVGDVVRAVAARRLVPEGRRPDGAVAAVRVALRLALRVARAEHRPCGVRRCRYTKNGQPDEHADHRWPMRDAHCSLANSPEFAVSPT